MVLTKTDPNPMITPSWWREASVYQIYPSSFKDSNGDGFGDLKGIISELDYIRKLGPDIVWLSPIYPSPLVDMGYDISDYKNIDRRYGTLDDIDKLIKELHDRGMKLLMDLVVNHTSDKHPWFEESRSSKANPMRDWYIWRPAKYDEEGKRQPPNNWCGSFSSGGSATSAWQWDEHTEEYYLHLFAIEQPDLNWENPKVREAVHDIVRFWLEKGVDGFRLDVINYISKVPGLPDAEILDPCCPYQRGSKYYANGPRFHEYMQQLGSIFKEYDAFSVGETPNVYERDEILKTVGADRGELNMIFQFDIATIDYGKLGRFSPGNFSFSDIKRILEKNQVLALEGGGWNAPYLENHDQPRAISRFASDNPEYRSFSSKLMAVFLLFQSGTPYIYQGQEIAMANLPKEWGIEEYKDIATVGFWKILMETNPTEETKAKAMAQVQRKARDNARTPMHWDSSPNAGFTRPDVTPWMRVTPDHSKWNARTQENDPSSVFSFWSKALAVRKEYKNALVYGSFKLLPSDQDTTIAYMRGSVDGNIRIASINNFSEQSCQFGIQSASRVSKVLLSSYDGIQATGPVVYLRPYEALLIVVE